MRSFTILNIRFQLILKAFISVFFFFFLLTFSFSAKAQKKYNLIFINVDDLSIANGTYGNKFAPTPNIDRIAQHGVVFNNVYCQYTLCSPSRTSTFSGTRVKTTQIVNNDDSIRKGLGAGFRFLPEYFHDYGYRTESYGKFMCNHDDEVSWDYYINESSGDGGFTSNPDDENTINTSIHKTAANEGRQEPIWFIDTIYKSISATDDGKETNQFVKALKKTTSTPFFFNLGLQTHNFFTPLLQYWNKIGDPSVSELLPVDSGFIYTNVYGNGSGNIPLSGCPSNDTSDIPKIALKYLYNYTDAAVQRLRHAYYGEIIQSDANIGKVIDQIDSLNLWDNSVIVFWSDHGLSMGEHNGMYLKVDMFEESLRIPMIICAPGIKPSRCDRLVESIDLYQTLTELCGLPAQNGKEGASLVPLMENPEIPWKKAIFSNLQRNANFDTLLATAVRTEQWHYNNWQDQGEELYDIKNDSQEIYNLAKNSKYIDTLNKMRTLFNEGWQAANAPFYASKLIYRDADGDGYGANTESTISYFGRDGFVDIQGDCDDNNSLVNPDRPEVICNNLDDNCDNVIDEGKPVAVVLIPESLDLCKNKEVILSSDCNAGCEYQWMKDSIIIPNENDKQLVVKIKGNYALIESLPNGCQSISDEVSVFESCNSSNDLLAFPNPSKGNFTISYTSRLNEKIEIFVYSSTGQLVYRKSKQAIEGINVYNIDLSSKASGIYFLKIKDKNIKLEIYH